MYCDFCRCSDCCCEQAIDPMVRLAPSEQVKAYLEAEDHRYGAMNEDPEYNWFIHLRSLGWTEDQVMGRAQRPEFADETLAICPDVRYSAIIA